MLTYIPRGGKIKELRLGLPESPSQAVIATKLGIHRITLANIETGKYRISKDLAEKMAAFFHVEVAVIAEEQFMQLKKNLPPDVDIKEIVDYLLEHPAERKVVLNLVRGARAHSEAILALRTKHRKPRHA